jgi:Flp pilus assembly protein TadB
MSPKERFPRFFALSGWLLMMLAIVAVVTVSLLIGVFVAVLLTAGMAIRSWRLRRALRETGPGSEVLEGEYEVLPGESISTRKSG